MLGYEVSNFTHIQSKTQISLLIKYTSLAYAEIYMTLAHIVRRFELKPHETTAEHLIVRRELGVGYSLDMKFDIMAKVVGIIEE